VHFADSAAFSNINTPHDLGIAQRTPRFPLQDIA
jgi:hypothetical protein